MGPPTPPIRFPPGGASRRATRAGPAKAPRNVFVCFRAVPFG